MKFNQDVPYNRDCPIRWSLIEKHLIKGKSMDVGSAEGYYARKLTKWGKVISIEGSEFVYNQQSKLNKGFDIDLYKWSLNHKNILELPIVDNMLLLSVLHWFENPDEFLKISSKRSKIMFIELPDLDCKSSWNQNYLKRIKKDFDSIENYLIEMTGKQIIDQSTNFAKHVGNSRTVFVMM
jgi:hypothetical protein